MVSVARIKDPIQFSAAFRIDPARLERLGILDTTLNVDTKLFIDPLLLDVSQHREMRRAAVAFRTYFEGVAKLLAASQTREDIAWRSARRRLTFAEVRGTCLGYGGASISGSGVGHGLTERLLKTAKEIVDLGVRDPQLFVLLSLLESDIGPDRISDMTTNVILANLASFGERAAKRLRILTHLRHCWSEVLATEESSVGRDATKQLEVYKAAEEASRAYYLVIDVGGMGRKDEQLAALRNRASKAGARPSELAFVNGQRRRSASKM